MRRVRYAPIFTKAYFVSVAVVSFTIIISPNFANSQSQPSSLWDHNNSVMALYANGSARTFLYHDPRPAMREVGVQRGTLLFSGSKDGDSYSGTAYIFSRHCTPHPYSVSGIVDDDGRRVTMTGTAPTGFNSACRPVGYFEDTLVFTLREVLSPPPPVSQAPSISQGYVNSQQLAQRRTQLTRTQCARRPRRTNEPKPNGVNKQPYYCCALSKKSNAETPKMIVARERRQIARERMQQI